MDALTYRMENGYQMPNLAMPQEPTVTLGKYALLRKKYLKQHRRILYANLLTSCKLNEHLAEIEQTAMQRMELLTAQMAAAQGVDEQMKARNQMEWVGLMNNIRQAAEESVLNDLVYA